MKRSSLAALAALAAFGCKDDEKGTPGPVPTVEDTGWFSETDPSVCNALVQETEPAANDTDWYWRDALTVLVTEADTSAFDAVIYGPTGQVVTTEIVWGEGLGFEVTFEGGLTPDADHTLEVTDCAGTTRIPFRTSAYGLPLTAGTESLTGNTYQLDLVTATWVQPSGLGPLLAGFFTTPILLGVRLSNDEIIDLLGAPGYTDINGQLLQDPSATTWEFPVTDFTDAPYVSAMSDNVVFSFSGVEIPIQDFVFETTFSADGSSLGGTVLHGTADTRYLDELIDEDDPAAICDIAASIGTVCVPCADTQPYCLVMEVRDVDGELVPGLTLSSIE